jgi:RNA polymerase sigma factor (sigma-70 family)
MDRSHVAESAIERGDRRVREAIEGLPPDTDPQFWQEIRSPKMQPEVLVHLIRRFLARGQHDHANTVTGVLIDRVYATARRIVQERMEYSPQLHDDAVQQAYELMWRAIAADKPLWERNFWWVFKAVCIDACRKFLPPKTDERDVSWNEHSLAPSSVPEVDEWENGPGGLIYREALATLSEEERQVWHLYFEEDLPQKAIATRLSCTDKTVYNRLRSARQKLAACYPREGAKDE